MALRIEATRPSSGSFQPLISTSTTSGRMRSRRSRKLLDIADVLVLDDDAERQIGEAGLRLLPELAVLDCQSNGQRIHSRVSRCAGLSFRSLPPGTAARDARHGARPGWRRRQAAGFWEQQARLAASGVPGPASAAATSCSNGMLSGGRIHRHRSGLVHARLAHRNVGVRRHERRGAVQIGHRLSARESAARFPA